MIAQKLILFYFLLMFFSLSSLVAQVRWPEQQLTPAVTEAHMQFLASDDLEGRRTGSRGNNIAARYIAAHFEGYGLKKAPGLNSYYQSFLLEEATAPKSGSLKMGATDYKFQNDFLILNGAAIDVKTTAVFAGHGWVDATTGHDDYRDLDVRGKVVFVLPGTPTDEDRRAIATAAPTKRQLAAERGAVAVFELYRMSFPWDFFRRSYARSRIQLTPAGGDNTEIVYGFFKEPSPNPVIELQNGKSLPIELKSAAGSLQRLPAQNVVGIVEGTDPDLRNEYVLLTAHYDHVGVGQQGGGAYTAQDSIFNGARDNAFGTVALLAAAKALAQQPPARSVIFLAVTGEELGLLGSTYYSENPLIPLRQVIFNFNADTGGYNNTGVVGIVGYGRTGTDELMQEGLKPFGLRVRANPAPEQNLFDRSDNVAFARKGVPCVTYTPGFDEFDEEITRYYHQVADNPDTIDYVYLHKFSQGFAHIARLIANRAERPVWKTGDKYEAAGKTLYNE